MDWVIKNECDCRVAGRLGAKMTDSPIKSAKSPFPDASVEPLVTPDTLARHVYQLAAVIGERNVFRPQAYGDAAPEPNLDCIE
jgi:hypothetical protein